ncbi:MAG: membrane lipoprotein lipid attachment site-containing protein [Anoxybacillus gonensis]|nr:membrane lipoprotein lipid attachment site-containing protein [Anoxybacillus gonensis]
MKRIKMLFVITAVLLLSGCSDQVNNLIDKAANIYDKIGETDAKISNTISAFNLKVQIVKRLEYEYDGDKFTLNDVFNYFLDHPKWEVEKVDGFEVLIVSGGIKPEILGLNLDKDNESSYDKAITKYVTESSKVAFIFPFRDDTLLPDEITYYFEVGGQKIPGENGSAALQELTKIYGEYKKQTKK